MRIFLYNLLMVLVACGAGNAFAEDLPSAPGWSLSKIQQEKADNDYSYGDSRVYFSLKPPDQRPAITVDARTADRLRAGEANVEGVYSGQNQRAAQQSREEEYVYGNRANGIVVAEPVVSTLTAADGRKDIVEAPVASNSRSSSSSSESSLGGLSSGGGSDSPRRSYASSSAPSRNSTAASAPPPSVTGASAPAGGSQAVTDPRAIANAQNKAAVDPIKGNFQGGVSANNEAGGFAIKKKDKNGKEIKEKDKDFIVWPNGEPGSEENKPRCAHSLSNLYSQATVERITVPAGCTTISVRAWGAGGGSGGLDDEGSSQGGGTGGGGAYVFTKGYVDVSKFDVVIVVGGPGGHAKGKVGGAPGFISGGKGGSSDGSTGGGGGGGYSGVFLVERSKVRADEKPIDVEKAIVIAAGGGGGSATGESGGGGGITQGGGNGASQSGGGIGNGDGKAGVSLMGGDAGSTGGGGGGGLFGGGGGGAASNSEGQSSGGGGGSSFYRFLDNFETGSASGAQAGNKSYKDRGNAGDPGMPGKVILEFY